MRSRNLPTSVAERVKHVVQCVSRIHTSPHFPLGTRAIGLSIWHVALKCSRHLGVCNQLMLIVNILILNRPARQACLCCISAGEDDAECQCCHVGQEGQVSGSRT